jgi:hypothetical protein
LYFGWGYPQNGGGISWQNSSTIKYADKGINLQNTVYFPSYNVLQTFYAHKSLKIMS